MTIVRPTTSDDRLGRGRVGDPDRLDAVRQSGLRPNAGIDQLDRLVRLAARAVGAPTLLLSIVDERRQFFPAHVGLGEPWAARGETPLSHSVCSHLVEQGGALVIDDLGADGAWSEHPARLELGVEAYCGVPLLDGDGVVLGSLCAIDASSRPWSDDDVAQMREWSALIGDIAAMHRTHDVLVADLQRRLQPPAIVHPANGRIDAVVLSATDAAAVGGDFYDVRRRPDGAIDIVLGDAVGHGVASTQAAAQLRAAVSVLLDTTPAGPVEVLCHLSDSVANLPGCDFATMLVVRIDADGTGATWARAGAMPPVHVAGDHGGPLFEGSLPLLGLPVGECEAGRVELAPGERLVLFSDGLVDRRPGTIDDAFADIADIARSTGSVEALVDRLLGDTNRQDDVTLVRWTRHA